MKNRLLTGSVLAGLLLAQAAGAGPVKRGVALEIRPPSVKSGPAIVHLDITARMDVRSVSLTAYLDKVPLPAPYLPPGALKRGERRGVDVLLTVPDQKEHWFFAEAEVTLATGERVRVGKSVLLNPRKNQKPETYETYRTEKPRR